MELQSHLIKNTAVRLYLQQFIYKNKNSAYKKVTSLIKIRTFNFHTYKKVMYI